MALVTGTHLGRYEILAPLGAGGMGEVYRARDTRLDREVAIKILPESVARDPDRLARFEREAKAVAALSHPNILALHDAGTEDGTTFAVMELLEGETVRDRLSHGPMPLRRAIDTATQIARGLAAAHGKGLVHRDLKPENIFLVADGQVKILDFGLAKSADGGDASGATATQALMTDPGTVLGTVGYMAPEQVRGHAIDARTDLFALGAVLYEMLTGERAFRRETPAETMTAILREDPPDLPAPQMAQAPALDRIVRHCLEKSPTERFQSARDVAFALEALSGTTGTTGTTGALDLPTSSRPGLASRPMSSMAAVAALGLVVIVAVAAWLTGYLHVGSAGAGGAGIADITYQPVTFDEGFVFAARFARDGRTIVYSADWENQRRDIFVTSLDNSGARALGYKDADLLSVAADGALAILVDSTIPAGNPYFRRGTIARASLTGGAPRKELDRINFADFAPDGSLAVTRSTSRVGAGAAIEWPQGKVVVDRTSANGSSPLPNPRIAPSGSHAAFFSCDTAGCALTIADTAGKTVAKSRPFSDWWGLAWAPGGREVWFAAVADSSGVQCTVYALDLNGRERLLFRTPGALTLHDVSAEGRVLASFDQQSDRLEMRDSPTTLRDLSWKEGGLLRDVSPNGIVLFGETGNSGGPAGSVYVRRPGDPEPIRLSDGQPIAISDDGATALVRSPNAKQELTLSLVPTAGLAQVLDVGPIELIAAGAWLKDGRLVLDLSRKPGDPFAVFVRPANGGPLAPFLPPHINLTWRAVAPDGQHISAVDETGRLQVCTVPTTGLATCTPLPGTTEGDRVAGWTADSGSIFVYRQYPTPVKVERVNITTGRRELLTTLQTASAAVSGVRSLFVTPGGALFYNYARNRSALYVISGLK